MRRAKHPFEVSRTPDATGLSTVVARFASLKLARAHACELLKDTDDRVDVRRDGSLLLSFNLRLVVERADGSLDVDFVPGWSGSPFEI